MLIVLSVLDHRPCILISIKSHVIDVHYTATTVTYHPPRCSCKSLVSAVTLGEACRCPGPGRCWWLVAGHGAVWLPLSLEGAVLPGGRLCPWHCRGGSWTPSD